MGGKLSPHKAYYNQFRGYIYMYKGDEIIRIKSFNTRQERKEIMTKWMQNIAKEHFPYDFYIQIKLTHV